MFFVSSGCYVDFLLCLQDVTEMCYVSSGCYVDVFVVSSGCYVDVFCVFRMLPRCFLCLQDVN